jgi:ABC-type transport system substrate-binding protein
MAAVSGVLRVGVLTPWHAGDPRQATDFANLTVTLHVFEAPFVPAAEGGRVEPALLDLPLRAEGGAAAATLYSAEVRRGRVFSDGTPVTAAHVAASLQRTPAFADQAQVSVHGERLVFRLARPNARFDLVLANFNNPIVHEGRAGLVGSGPYALAPDSTPERVRLVRNPHYTGTAHAGEIHCICYPPDEEGRPARLIAAVNSGEVDFTAALSKDDLNHVKGVRKLIELGYSTAVLYFNTERAPWGEARVRHAVAAAVDRRALAAASYTNPLAFAATGLLPPSLGGFPDGVLFDPARAAALLAESGVRPPSKPLRMLVVPLPRPHLPHPRATARLVCERLESLGLQVEVVVTRDIADYLEQAARGDYDLALSGWIPESPDPLDYLETMLASWSVPDTRRAASRVANLSRWRHPGMDEALQRHRAEARPETLRRIHDLLHAELPLLPLLYGPRVAVLSWRVRERPASFAWRPFLAELPLGT